MLESILRKWCDVRGSKCVRSILRLLTLQMVIYGTEITDAASHGGQTDSMWIFGNPE